MKTDLYWIPGPFAGRLAICPRPRGGDWLGDELAEWKSDGVAAVVSLLSPEEVLELELGEEPALCQQLDMLYIHLPVKDRAVPESKVKFVSLVESIITLLKAGQHVAVHCRQGIGRAGLAAAAVLAAEGMSSDQAWAQVSAARGKTVPDTPEQWDWLTEIQPSIVHNKSQPRRLGETIRS